MSGRAGAVLLLAIVGVVGWFYFGGSAEAPEDLPKPKAPDADEAAGGVQSLFNAFGDWITQRGEVFWRLVVIGALVAIGAWVFRKVPVVVWLVLAVIAFIIAAMA